MAQTPILAKGDPRFSEPHYPVTLADQRPGLVTIERGWQVIVLHTAQSHEHHRWDGILEWARAKQLPEWCTQVAPIMARIERIFTAEREQGLDPHIRWRVNDTEVRYENLALGTGLVVTVDELKRRIANGERLPSSLDRPEIRARLGLS
jgi:hypothetical protein